MFLLKLHRSRSQAGFTLIEILIVMVIIGILATLGFGGFQSSQMKSRDARRKSDLAQITRALELYYNDKGSYPLANGSGEIVGCGAPGAKTACSWGEVFEEPITNRPSTVYMVTLPTDPKSPAFDYFYYTDGTGDFYQIYARLENTNDGDIAVDAEEDPQVFSDMLCGADNCNYGVTSANSTPETNREVADD